MLPTRPLWPFDRGKILVCCWSHLLYIVAPTTNENPPRLFHNNPVSFSLCRYTVLSFVFLPIIDSHRENFQSARRLQGSDYAIFPTSFSCLRKEGRQKLLTATEGFLYPISLSAYVRAYSFHYPHIGKFLSVWIELLHFYSIMAFALCGQKIVYAAVGNCLF